MCDVIPKSWIGGAMPKKKSDASMQEFPLYQKWNATTALCYHNHMRCDICSHEDACDLAEPVWNEFGMKNVKFATLMTMRNCGLKGLKRYLEE